MRAIRSLAFVVVLLLSACATAANRDEQPPAVLAPEASPSKLGGLASPAPAHTAPASPTAPPTTTPASPTATVVPSAPTPSTSDHAAPSLPAYLRTLHLEIPAGNSYEPKAMALYPALDRVYVRSHADWSVRQGMVTVIDLSSRQVVAAVATAPDAASDGGMVVDTVRSRIYAVNAAMATASVLDAQTLALIETLPDVLLLALDEASGRVYVVGKEQLRMLDPDRFDTLAQVPLPGGALWLALALNPAAGRLYLCGRLYEGNTLLAYNTADLVQLAATPLGGGPESLVVDSTGGRVYVALNAGSNSLLGVLDADGRLLEERGQGRWAGRIGLAVDDGGKRLFLVRESRRNQVVTVLDPTTWQTTAIIPLSLSPYSLTWDAHARRLLVSHPAANAIGVVDVDAGRVEAIIATTVYLEDIEVDPARGQVYVTDWSGRLRVFDSDTDAELASLPAQGTLSVDGPHGRLYTGSKELGVRVRVFDTVRLEPLAVIPMSSALPVADPHSGGLYLVRAGVYIADTATMTVTGVLSDTLPLPDSRNPSPAADSALVDPGTGRLFVVMDNGRLSTGHAYYLNVYEPITHRKICCDPRLDVDYLDLDPVSGRAYLSQVDMVDRSITVLEDGRTVTARLDGLHGPLRVDPGLGRLYVSTGLVTGEQESQLFVLDARSLETLGAVPLPHGLRLYALDPERHLLYLSDGGGEVQIWSAVGAE